MIFERHAIERPGAQDCQFVGNDLEEVIMHSGKRISLVLTVLLAAPIGKEAAP